MKKTNFQKLAEDAAIMGGEGWTGAELAADAVSFLYLAALATLAAAVFIGAAALAEVL